VQRALEEAGIGLAAIDAFAVSIGPGSFTGLRIGLATVKAFALGTAKPVAAVPTLAAMAWPEREPGVLLVPLLDARRGELYAAAYRGLGDGLVRVLEEGVWRPEELEARLAGLGLARSVVAAPRAEAVGEIGARILARGQGRPAADLVPRYLRRAEAEARRTGKPLEPAGGAGPAGELL
jgi:tRNA threonylcarbamoyladenosine biosynthesis protein TsaB